LHCQVEFTRFLAAARKKLWWMTPEWGTASGDVPPETQFLLLELAEGGPYAILLPLIDSDTFRGTIRPPRCCGVSLTLLRGFSTTPLIKTGLANAMAAVLHLSKHKKCDAAMFLSRSAKRSAPTC